MTTLTFREKILKSDNNRVISVPNLSYRSLIPTKIDFQSEGNQWTFEVSLKTASQEIVRLSQSYFHHKTSLDLEKYLGKIEEGDHLELQIKPKGSKKDLILTLTYHYQPSLGSIIYQNGIRVVDLKLNTCTLLNDLAQMKPTLMKLKCDDQILELAFRPKFNSDEEDEFPTYEKTEILAYSTEIDFNALKETNRNLIKLLQYYYLDVKTDNETSMDSEIYILCYGFKKN
jgi:hypothetical protein